MIKSDCLNKPNLIFIAMNIPLNNGLLIFAICWTNIKCFSWETFDDISWSTFFCQMRCLEFPELMVLFETLWNYDACPTFWWFFFGWEYHVIFCAEDSIFSITNRPDSKLLIGSIIPLIQNDFVIILGILRYIKHHIISHSRHKFVQTIFSKAHNNRFISLEEYFSSLIILMKCISSSSTIIEVNKKKSEKIRCS